LAAEAEKAIRKWLDQVESYLKETPPDLPRCQNAFATLRLRVERILDEQFRPIKLSERLWSDALLMQARDDLAAAELLAAANGPASSLAMLLQMVFEKLAKAALARTDVPCFIANRTSHVAASRLVSVLKNHNDFLQLRYNWKDVLPLVQALENAHPAVAKKGPHLEYPWEAGEEMGLPATHVNVVKQLADPLDPKGLRLLRFARELSNRFDEFFP
jgi:hypothetical protein